MRNNIQVNKRLVPVLLLAILALSSLVVLGQQPKKVLTNDDVIKMVKEGLPDNVIVSTIQQFPANYDVSPDALIQMKRQGVSGIVLTAVLEAEKVKNSKPTDVTASSESKTPQIIKPEIRNDFVFELKLCQSSGGDSINCWFAVTNKAQERSLTITLESHIDDNLNGRFLATDVGIANQGRERLAWGGFEPYASNTLKQGNPLGAVLVFQKVNPEATSIRVLRIMCRWERENFYVDFKNVPITRKGQPSSTTNDESLQGNQKAEDFERYKVRTTRKDVKNGEPVRRVMLDEPSRILPKGTTPMVSNGKPVYRIPFKYRVKHFTLDPRKRLDLCAGTITIGEDFLEIRTDSGNSELGYKCDSNTYNLAKDNIQKLKDTFSDTHWYDFKPTADHINIKFAVFENNGKDKKKKEFYLYPAEASIKYGTRTHTLTGRVLVCPECPAIVCPNCQEDLVAMKNLFDEFYSKDKSNTNIQKPARIIIY
jgi:hypothetical protein